MSDMETNTKKDSSIGPEKVANMSLFRQSYLFDCFAYIAYNRTEMTLLILEVNIFTFPVTKSSQPQFLLASTKDLSKINLFLTC